MSVVRSRRNEPWPRIGDRARTAGDGAAIPATAGGVSIVSARRSRSRRGCQSPASTSATRPTTNSNQSRISLISLTATEASRGRGQSGAAVTYADMHRVLNREAAGGSRPPARSCRVLSSSLPTGCATCSRGTERTSWSTVAVRVRLVVRPSLILAPVGTRRWPHP